MDRVLIVDDNIELLQLYKMMITMTGRYRICGTATGGNEAVSKYTGMAKKPDLVLMDVNMPDMDGISAATAIHRLDKDANILFVTADDIYKNDLPLEISNAGILRKPFSKDEFFRQINKALGARVLQKPLES
jgi:CheY-like chemotaxis protein